MIAATERPLGTITEGIELAALGRALEEQGRMLVAQRHMLELLDARREALDDLIADLLPVSNAAMLMLMRHAERVGALQLGEHFVGMVGELDAVRRAPAPGMLALLRRLWHPDVRKGAALMIAGLGAAGRAAGAQPLTRMNGRIT